MSQIDWIKKCREAAERVRTLGVSSFAIGGSVGRGASDVNSDLDLFLVVDEAALKDFLDVRTFDVASELARPTLFRGPIYLPEFGYSFTALTRDLTTLQLNVKTPSILIPRWFTGFGSIIIFDDDGTYGEYVKQSRDIKLDVHEKLSGCMKFFWLRSVFTWRSVRRNQMWMAARYLVDMRDQMLWVLRLSGGILPKNPNAPAKSIEQDIGMEELRILEPSVPTTSPASVIDAFEYAMQWFEGSTTGLVGSNESLAAIFREGQRVRAAIVSDIRRSS